jgi:hypothetical protein
MFFMGPLLISEVLVRKILPGGEPQANVQGSMPFRVTAAKLMHI